MSMEFDTTTMSSIIITSWPHYPHQKNARAHGFITEYCQYSSIHIHFEEFFDSNKRARAFDAPFDETCHTCTSKLFLGWRNVFLQYLKIKIFPLRCKPKPHGWRAKELFQGESFR
jgi:hypothetical protein